MYIYELPPIDFYTGAIMIDKDSEMFHRIWNLMPEEPRNEEVYLFYYPNPGTYSFEPVYICKADNNGTTYMFSKEPMYFDEIRLCKIENTLW